MGERGNFDFGDDGEDEEDVEGDFEKFEEQEPGEDIATNEENKVFLECRKCWHEWIGTLESGECPECLSKDIRQQ